jgi:short-subunit dehydrogenase
MRIVVTGATSGIGQALALRYAAPDTTLGLIGRRQALLGQVSAQCTAQGATVVPAALDVRDSMVMQEYAGRFLDRAGGIDIVIANAGSGTPDDLVSGNARPHSCLFEVNVIGLLNTLLPFVPRMIEQRHGQLVAIASVAGFRALPGSTTYAATKIAVRALMEGYGWELRRHGILTTTINPGFVVSEMTAGNRFPMPFLLPTDAAAHRIVRAIAQQRRVYTFPWPMAILARLLPLIPGAILARAAPRLRE